MLRRDFVRVTAAGGLLLTAGTFAAMQETKEVELRVEGMI